MALVQSESKRTRPRRTFTMDDEAFERLTLLSEDADTSRSRLLELLVGYDHEAYERLMQLATSAEVSPGEYLNRSCCWSVIRMNGLRTWPSRRGRLKHSSWST